MARDGVRTALVFATSAYGGYSACRQYDEDIERARKAVGDAGPAADQAAALLRPPAVRRGQRRRRARGPGRAGGRAGPSWRGGPGWCSPRTRCRWPPTPRPDRRPRAGTATRGRSPRPPGWWRPRSGCRRARPGVAVPVRPAAGALAGAGHRRPSRRRCTPTGCRRWSWRRSASSPTTSRSSGTWTTKRGSGPPSWAWASPAPRPPGPDPRFADMVVELIAEHQHDFAPRGLGEVPAGRLHAQRRAVRRAVLRAGAAARPARPAGLTPDPPRA